MIFPNWIGCSQMYCSAPLTESVEVSHCGCVYPIRVVIDVGINASIFSKLCLAFEIEVAAGIYVRQSQVKTVSTCISPRGEMRTEVTLYIVPIGSKFDKTTAYFIYNRFWQKKLQISKPLFHDYEMIYVHYPGLPLSHPPYDDSLVSGPSEVVHEYPIGGNVPHVDTKKMDARIISITALSSFLLVSLCIAIIIFVFQSKKSTEKSLDTSSIARKPGIKCRQTSTRIASFRSMIATRQLSVKTFTLSEIGKATNYFDNGRKIGEGGSGCVYHGILEDGSNVAVKLLKIVDQNRDKEREFVTEVDMLSRLHHRNLVKLIGLCFEGRRPCLVYEFVRNGSVQSHLHGIDKAKGPLEWDARMTIALGSARALAYLHEDSAPCVIHRDFKASNVLLDEDFTPKLSDFGLAREASDGSQHVSTRVMGTFGYLAPEYAMTGHLLIKSDVYSYGVMLLELLSGRKPVQVFNTQQCPENIVVWARLLVGNKDGLKELIDPYLQQNNDFDTIAKVASVASLCVRDEPSQRPYMGEVVEALKLIAFNNKGSICMGSSSGSPGGRSCQESSFLETEGALGSDEETCAAQSDPGHLGRMKTEKKKAHKANKIRHRSV